MSLNPRLVLGKRANGDTGVFMSPSGVNAMTAADSALLMNISSKISQLILLGTVPSNALVSLGLGSQPIVLLTTYSAFVLIDENNNLITLNGPTRPSPVGSAAVTVSGTGANVTINSSGASMSISTPGKVTYAVYSKTF